MLQHPLAIYVAQVHIADLQAQAANDRMAKQARKSKKPGLVASLVASVRNLFRSTDTSSAATAA